MIIEEEDFRLTPIDDNSPFFDLELIRVIRPRGGTERKEFKEAGFGIPLESAVKKICAYRVSKKHGDKAITLKEYFNDFKSELDKFKDLL